VPQDFGAKCILIEELVGHGRQWDQESGKHRPIPGFEVVFAFQHPIE
jgi:hypothetical protein